MGNPKQKWTSEEEEALRKGVLKHGTGKWKDIQRDPEFNPYLLNRSNIDLKDKWRNLSCSANGQGPREKSRNPKPKMNPEDPAAQLTSPSQSSAIVAVADPSNAEDSSKGLTDGKNPMNNSMIFEAISTLNELNGSDTSAIVNYIEQKHGIFPNVRRILSTRLRRLVAQDKLEKVNTNNYKLKSNNGGVVSLVPKTPAPKVETPPRQLPIAVPKITVNPHEEAAIAAASMVVDAENKSTVAATAVREYERIAALVEMAEAKVLLAEEEYEKCLAAEAAEQEAQAAEQA